MPEEFGVHFRREGVLHQIEKLTDPDYSLTSDVSEYNLSWSQVEILSLKLSGSVVAIRIRSVFVKYFLVNSYATSNTRSFQQQSGGTPQHPGRS